MDAIPHTAQPRPVHIETPRGTPLAGLLYGDAAAATSAIVFCHGFLGTQDTLAPRFAELLLARSRASVVLTFDYAGFGDSPGPARRVDPFAQVEDVCAAVRAVGGLVPSSRHVGLVGISFGSGIALQAGALDRNVHAVASLSSYRTGEEWLRDMRPAHRMAALLEHLDAERRDGRPGAEATIPLTEIFPRDPIGAAYEQNLRDAGSDRASELDATSVEQILRFRPVDHAEALRSTPTLLLHCEADVTMWPQHANDFAVQAGAAYEVLRGVDHYNVYEQSHLERVCDRIAQFFEESR